MKRNARALLLALLCVLAVSLGAAALADPVDQSGGGSGDGGRQAGGGADRGAGNSNTDYDRPDDAGGDVRTFSGTCVPFLRTPAFFALAALVLAGAFLAAARATDRTVAAVGVGVTALVASPLYLVFTDCRRGVQPSSGGGMPEFPELTAGTGDPAGGVATAADSLVSVPVLVAGLVVVVAVVAVLAYAASGGKAADGEDAPDDARTDEVAGDDALSAVGRTASAAADRISEGGDVENEVYRAWREMAVHVGAGDPRSGTPGEFAEAARAAGLADAHVETLTELFREVRYGGADATADREARAVDALRAVEAARDSRPNDNSNGPDGGSDAGADPTA